MDRHVDGFTEVYDWICHLQFTFKNAGSTEALELTRIDGKIISVHACSHEKGNVVLGLWCDKVCLVDLGECRIGECSEEAMQENLLPLFSDICVYGFFQVTDQGIADFELPPIGCNVLLAGLKKLKKHVLSSSRSRSEEEEMLLNETDRQKIACEDTDELQRLDIGLGTIESAKFRPAFNSVFRAASYSHLLHAKTQFSANVVLELQKLAEQTQKETLVIIGPDATHLLMKYLAAKFTEIRLRHGSESIKSFKMSYSTGLSGFSTINAYCPRLSMQLQLPPNQDKRKDADLELALSRHVMHCFIHLCHKVSVFTDWIDVEFQIDNLRCQAFPFNTNKPFPSHLENEWYFPAKIALTLSPEPASDVHAFSLGASSQNPEVSVTRERIREVTLKAEQAMGIKFEPTLGAELKIGRKNSYTYKLNNWVFDLSSVNNTGGRLEWTLYDNSFGKPVFSYTPPQFNFFNGNTWSRGDYYKAFRAFAQEEGSVRPFTAGGGVVFAGDRYGIPMTWRLKRDLEGQTLKWIVEGEIWFAYYPNKYCTNRHMEIRSHKFLEQVQLRLQQRNPGPYLI